MTVLRSLGIAWDVEIDKADLFALERLLQRLQRSFAVLAIGGAAALAKLVGGSMEFEDSLARVMSMVNLTGNDLTMLTRKFGEMSKDLSRKFNMPFQDIHENMRNVLNLGVDPLSDGFGELLDVVLKLQKVGESDPLKTARTLEKMKKAWPHMEYAEMANMLFIASKIAPNFVEELADAGNKAISIARIMRQPLSQTLAVLAQMSTMSVSGAQLGTRLFSGMSLMIRNTGQAKKALSELEIDPAKDFVDPKTGGHKKFAEIFEILRSRMSKYNDATRAQLLLMIVGRRVGNAYVPILDQQADVLTRYIRLIEEGGEQLQNGFITRMDTATQSTGKLGKAWELLNVRVFGPIKDLWKTMSENLATFINNVDEMLAQNPRLAMFLSYLGTFITLAFTLGGAIGLLTASFKLISIAMERLAMVMSVSWARAFWAPIAFAALLIILMLLVEDLILSFYGYDTVLGRVAKKHDISVHALRPFVTWFLILAGAAMAALGSIAAFIVVLFFLGVALAQVAVNWKLFKTSMRDAYIWFKTYLNDMEAHAKRLASLGGLLFLALLGPAGWAIASGLHIPGLLGRILDKLFPEIQTLDQKHHGVDARELASYQRDMSIDDFMNPSRMTREQWVLNNDVNYTFNLKDFDQMMEAYESTEKNQKDPLDLSKTSGPASTLFDVLDSE